MKIEKTGKVLMIGMLGSMLVQPAIGALTREWDNSTASTTEESTPVTTPVKKAETREGSETKTCAPNAVSLGMLNTLMPDFKELNVRMVGKNNDTARISVPRYINNCMELKFQYHQVGNDIFVSATNEKVFDPSDYPQKEFNDRFEACMEKSGALKANNKANAEYAPAFSQSFPVKIDQKKNMSVHFSSAKFPNYPVVNGEPLDNSHDPDCFKGEQLKVGGLTVFQSPFEQSMQYYENICNGSDYNELYQALQDLSSSQAGNAQALDDDVKQIMKKVLNDKLFESVEKMSESKIERLKELNKEIGKAKSEDVLAPLVKEYNGILADIEKFVLTPRIAQLKRLYEVRKKTDDRKELRELDKEIKALNQEIGEFSKNVVDNRVISVMNEYGMPEAANKAFAFKLKSAHYSQMNFGPGREGYPKTTRKIEKVMEQKMKKFERISSDKEKEYLAKQGYDVYSKDYALQAQNLVNKRKFYAQRDQESLNDIQKDMSKYCRNTFWGGIKDKKKCQKAQTSYQRKLKRAQKRYQGFGSEINYYTGQATTFYQIEQEYAETQKRQEFDEFGDDMAYMYESELDYFRGSSNPFAGQGYTPQNPMMQQPYNMTGNAGMMVNPGAQFYSGGQFQYGSNPYAMPYGIQGGMMPVNSQMGMSPYPMMQQPQMMGGQQPMPQQQMPSGGGGSFTMPSGWSR